MKHNNANHLNPYSSKQVFVHNLNRIYFGKCYLNNNLEHIISLASFTNLQLAIHEFWGDIKKQIARMDEVYAYMGEIPSDKNCNPIKSIIKDEFCLDEKQEITVLSDMDIIMYLQLLEHVNITSCRMLIMVAKLSKYDKVNQLLTECFDESIDNDRLFMILSKEYLTED
jgi:ferritin-like metal-binding protein YciE